MNVGKEFSMHKAKQAIEYLLFESTVTNYQISKETGISPVVLGKYAKGISAIENMTFGNAIKLYDCYLKFKEENKVGNVDRDLLFGRLLAVSNVLGSRVFEEGKISIFDKYMQRFSKKPASTWTKIHTDLMEYTHKFGEVENKLLHLFDEIISEMDEELFDNKPLEERFLLGYYKQQHELQDKY